jgi:hypothetical protein
MLPPLVKANDIHTVAPVQRTQPDQSNETTALIGFNLAELDGLTDGR